MTMIENDEIQRLNQTFQAAMAAMRMVQGQPRYVSPDPDQIQQLGYRLKEALGDRFAQRVYDSVIEASRDCVREVVRDRFSSELRASLLGWQSERNFDLGRIEQRLVDRLSDAITERLVTMVHERAAGSIRERMSDSVREALSGTPMIEDVERIASRIRDRIEPELTARVAEAMRDRMRDVIREHIQQALRDRLAEALHAALGQHNPAQVDPGRVIEHVRERLADPIEHQVTAGIKDRMREVVRERLHEVVRARIDDVLRSISGGGRAGVTDDSWQAGSQSWGGSWPTESFGGPYAHGGRPGRSGQDGSRGQPWSSSASMVEILRDQIQDAVRSRFVPAIRERVVSTVSRELEDTLRDQLGTAIRMSVAEQQLIGDLDPDQFAEAIRTRISYPAVERLASVFRERLYQLVRDQLHDVIRTAVVQRGWSERQPSVPTRGNGTH
jgi:hypothetical protein